MINDLCKSFATSADEAKPEVTEVLPPLRPLPLFRSWDKEELYSLVDTAIQHEVGVERIGVFDQQVMGIFPHEDLTPLLFFQDRFIDECIWNQTNDEDDLDKEKDNCPPQP